MPIRAWGRGPGHYVRRGPQQLHELRRLVTEEREGAFRPAAGCGAGKHPMRPRTHRVMRPHTSGQGQEPLAPVPLGTAFRVVPREPFRGRER